MAFLIALAMAAVVAIFGLIPLREAAEYRFKNQLGKTLKGGAFLACAVIGLLTPGFAGWLLLGGGIAVGMGLQATDRKLLR
jgi:hypothetical protein